MYGCPHGPLRIPPLTPFYLGEDSPNTVGATTAQPTPQDDGDELGSPGFDSSGILPSILDRTLPMLEIDGGVLNDEIMGTSFCSIRGGTPSELAISDRTTEKNVISADGLSRPLPGKRKFADI